jgi:hypothetical protein
MSGLAIDGLNKDEDMTREPEMMKAYRDTWELGLHSYLTYLRADFLKAATLGIRIKIQCLRYGG